MIKCNGNLCIKINKRSSNHNQQKKQPHLYLVYKIFKPCSAIHSQAIDFGAISSSVWFLYALFGVLVIAAFKRFAINESNGLEGLIHLCASGNASSWCLCCLRVSVLTVSVGQSTMVWQFCHLGDLVGFWNLIWNSLLRRRKVLCLLSLYQIHWSKSFFSFFFF